VGFSMLLNCEHLTRSMVQHGLLHAQVPFFKL